MNASGLRAGPGRCSAAKEKQRGFGGRARGCGHHGLVLRRSCSSRMNLAPITWPPVVQDWAAGVGAPGAAEAGSSPGRSRSSLADLGAVESALELLMAISVRGS